MIENLYYSIQEHAVLSTFGLTVAYALTWLITLSAVLFPAFGATAVLIATVLTALIMGFSELMNRRERIAA